ncbi:hypothetical protein [Methylobacterium sp. WL116]|uniref:hypothetical protein n=1 Tax=Methylobacterium sp. WL116 TaxID=2603889 RepID=UPI001FF07B68|nr:hypothetical protein [Methylobacterium sp. WL116]
MTRGSVAGKVRDWAASARNLTLGRTEAVTTFPVSRPGAQIVLDADIPVDIGCIKVFRSENFPESGPLPWLDLPDAMELIERRLGWGELTPEQAEMCRFWAENGYYVARGAVDPDTIDAAWGAYEAVIAQGEITLAPEKATDDDPHPGRYLNPHLKVEQLDTLL